MKIKIFLFTFLLPLLASTQNANAQNLERKAGDHNLSGFVEKGSGKVIIPLVYDYASDFSEGIVALRNRNMKWGILNEKGETVVPFTMEYDYVGECHDGLLFVNSKDDDDKNGYINTKGKLIIPLKYQEAYDFKGGTAIVKQNGQYYRINKKNKKLETLTEKEVKRIYPFWWPPVILPASLPDVEIKN